MKRAGILFIGLSVVLALLGPILPARSVDAPDVVSRPITSAEAQAHVADWTVLVYMAADNNLEGFALADLNEMELVGSSEAVNIVVQVDRSAEYDAGDGDWSDTRRYFIQQDRRVTNLASERVDDGSLGELDTSDPGTLVDFATWAITSYPANRYALVIWDHGGSWQGLATDEFEGNNAMSLSELSGALQAITTNTGIPKLDVIGFDACLMGSFEVYRAIAPYGRFAIGSAELIPGDGWDYFGALDALSGDPTMDGDVFGRAVVDSFISYYTDIVTKYKVFNLGVVNLEQSGPVETALGEIKNVMQDQSGEAWAAIVQARTQTPVYGAFGDPQFIDIWAAADLIQFTGLLKDQSDNPALAAAADHVHTAGAQMIVYYRSSADPNATNLGGVSIYFPRTANLFEQRTDATRYPQEIPAGLSLWTDFLSTFFQTVRTQADADALGGKVGGPKMDGSQAALVFNMSEGKPGTRAAAFVKLDIGNQQRIIVDYAPIEWNGAEAREEVPWSGSIPWLTNGRSKTPVLLLRDPRDPNIGVVNGVFYPRNGSSVNAQLLFDLETNALISVWTMGEALNTVFPAQVVPGQGDVFQPVWMTSTTNNAWTQTPANVKLVFDEAAPLTLEWQRAPRGAYQIDLRVEDAAGNTGRDVQSVAVTANDEGEFAVQRITPSADIDGDGVANNVDNCPATPNPSQADWDRDGIGDDCDLFDDEDLDADGIPDAEDVCPGLYDPDQSGAECDFFADSDGDGIPDDSDLCPNDANAYSNDLDGDYVGDACDPSVDELDAYDDFDYYGDYEDCDASLDPDCDIYGDDDYGYGDDDDYGYGDDDDYGYGDDDYGYGDDDDYGYGDDDYGDDTGDYGDDTGDYGDDTGDYGGSDYGDYGGDDYGGDDYGGY